MKQSEEIRDRLRAGAVPAAGWTLDDWTKIGIVEDKIAKAKEDFRKDPENIVVEAGLWKWGYINSPLNDRLMLMIVPEIAEQQDGYLTDRGPINNYFPALGLAVD